MAGGSTPIPSDAGGKKTVDAQLNMVPFIDLLSVLIAFLLMTSVWTQVARLDVSTSPREPGGSSPEVSPAERLELTVLIRSGGYVLTWRGGGPMAIDKRGKAYDAEALTAALRQARAAHPENQALAVSCEDHVPYEEVVSVMGLALAERLTELSVEGVDGSGG